eukprot:CAMPEP_0183392064 /NCGR_PEP_ID=MMETSP0370-20130417/6876_1 /TAXON_ID=268820 /ORGANISM="Peridinium aciculiferum, Strain PAER-2" /LENGTH=510 /DNA_ID=CAMNT_0025571907 /DNA_START=60 /DNA_END=1592 /DNA_ORIENTATION=-
MARVLIVVALFAVSLAWAPASEVVLPSADDDECGSDEGGQCSLSALQRRGTKVSAAASEGFLEGVDPSLVFVESAAAADEDWSIFGSSDCDSPINCFNDQLDTVKFLASEGLYYEFDTAEGQKVWSTEVEGRSYYADAEVTFPLASASKLFTAFATMVTMQLKPQDWYPQKQVNEFKGWTDFSNFAIVDSKKKANLTIHELLTHTSGLPFGMRMSKEDLAKQTLFYPPGTAFGYTLGHRVAGWLLRDYWMGQPETKGLNFTTVDDCFQWLIFKPLGLKATKFDDSLTEAFGYSGQAGDASIRANGQDLMKLAVTALRRGKTLDGQQLISEANWNKWAIPNLLPGGKPSKDLVGWMGPEASWANWDVGDVKESIMKQSGDYGWNYFGATWHDNKEIGWCGFFSTCLRVNYQYDVAFVMMQRDVSDLKQSKLYVAQHFGEMAQSLQCIGGPKCVKSGAQSLFCDTSGKVAPQSATTTCPSSTQRGKGWGDEHKDTYFDLKNHACYAPGCAGR